MKNELIIAQYKDLPHRKPAERLTEMLDRIGLQELKDRVFPAASGLRIEKGPCEVLFFERSSRIGMRMSPLALLPMCVTPILILRSQQRSSGLTAGMTLGGQPLQ